jgi:hypothetical protein
MEAEKRRPPSLEVPAIRLDPETHGMVRAEVRRRAIETGEQPRYGDVVRGLVRRALRDAARQVQAELSDGVNRG